MARPLVPLIVVALAAAALTAAAEETEDMLGPTSVPDCDAAAGYHSAGSAYADNVVELISDLRDNASASPALYASGSTGEGDGAVFRVVACRGDITADDCFDCVSRAIQDVPAACNRSRSAAVLYGRCYVRVAATDFMGSRNDSGDGGVFTLRLTTESFTGFDSDSSIGAAAQLLNYTVAYTVDKAAAPLPRVYFGTGQALGLQALYSMAQCAPQLVPGQCRKCLNGLIVEFLATLMDGKSLPNAYAYACIVGWRCSLRCQLHDKFFSGDANVRMQIKGKELVPVSAPSTQAAPPLEAAAPEPSNTTGGRHTHHGRWGKVDTILVLILTVSGLVTTGILVLIFWYHRSREPIRQLEDGVLIQHVPEEEEHASIQEDTDREVVSYNYQVLQAATNNFSDANMMGKGGCGIVFKGVLDTGKEIGVKMLTNLKRDIKEFEREIALVAGLQHENVLRLLGHCFEGDKRLLVYEYAANGSLDRFCYEARGLRYLHSKKLLHRDMKPGNVLLDKNFKPKVADFDLMRVCDTHTRHTAQKVAGTRGFIAPECWESRDHMYPLSYEGDVYSFGVMLLEIITRRRTYSFEGENYEVLVEHVWQHWKEKTAKDVVHGDLGVEGQEQAMQQVMRCVHVGLLCVQCDRSKRPTMGQVVTMLKSYDSMDLPEPIISRYDSFRPTGMSSARLPCLGCVGDK